MVFSQEKLSSEPFLVRYIDDEDDVVSIIFCNTLNICITFYFGNRKFTIKVLHTTDDSSLEFK